VRVSPHIGRTLYFGCLRHPRSVTPTPPIPLANSARMSTALHALNQLTPEEHAQALQFIDLKHRRGAQSSIGDGAWPASGAELLSTRRGTQSGSVALGARRREAGGVGVRTRSGLARRVDGYIRVSRVGKWRGPRFISPSGEDRRSPAPRRPCALQTPRRTVEPPLSMPLQFAATLAASRCDRWRPPAVSGFGGRARHRRSARPADVSPSPGAADPSHARPEWERMFV
jgi:hypothetical protein